MDLLLVVFFISLLILVTGTIVNLLENIFLTEPMIAMLAGFILGPALIGIISEGSQAQTHQILITACKFTIAMALMATALRIPPDFFAKHRLTQSGLVIAGMILMWGLSSCIFYLLLPDYTFSQCLLFGAIISPTDPVIASTIITGKKAEKYLPSSIRHTLSFESGINDGLAYPIVILSIFLITSPSFPAGEWIKSTVLFETILSGVIAFFVGRIAGNVLHKAHTRNLMTKKVMLSYSLSLAFLLLAGLEYIGMNGILGVFIGGLAFTARIAKNEDIQEERVQESMERIFTIPIFFIFGLIMPWQEWVDLGWTALWITIGVLFFRRIPAFIAMTPFLPQFKNKYRDMLIMGWYGPVGVAALFYALHAKEQTGMEEAWTIPTLVVFVSTLVHGLTSVPFEKWYAKASGND